MIEVKRLSQMPFAIFDIVFAVAGAMTKISPSSHSEICSGLYSFISAGLGISSSLSGISSLKIRKNTCR